MPLRWNKGNKVNKNYERVYYISKGTGISKGLLI